MLLLALEQGHRDPLPPRQKAFLVVPGHRQLEGNALVGGHRAGGGPRVILARGLGIGRVESENDDRGRTHRADGEIDSGRNRPFGRIREPVAVLIVAGLGQRRFDRRHLVGEDLEGRPTTRKEFARDLLGNLGVGTAVRLGIGSIERDRLDARQSPQCGKVLGQLAEPGLGDIREPVTVRVHAFGRIGENRPHLLGQRPGLGRLDPGPGGYRRPVAIG